jgi:DNA-binding NarL/FixJ family response regulator
VDEQPKENQIRLVLVGDQALVRASLGRFLASQPGLEVAAECSSGTEALGILNGSHIDVVLLDFDLGLDQVKELMLASHDARHRTRFLIVAEASDIKTVAIALKLGAAGVFPKSEAPDRLVQATRIVASGAVWVDQATLQLLAGQLTDQNLPQPNDWTRESPLTEREQKVLLGILGGLTNRKIGHNLGLSEGSIKAIVQQLFYKAGVRTRSQLVRAALEGSLGAARRLAKPDYNSAGTATASTVLLNRE